MKSKRGNIVQITRLLEQFNDENVCHFKSKLLDELGIDDENERNFLCKILPILGNSSLLQDESIESLKQEAIKLGETQKMSVSNNHVTLHKFIEQQYNDKISQLPNSLIDHIGSYLNKKESIIFGMVNRQLYIESQSESYLFKRENDELYICNTRLDQLLSNGSNPFAYSAPQHLRLGWSANGANRSFSNVELVKRHRTWLDKSKWFNSLFRRLKRFGCGGSYFSLIPIDKLFGDPGSSIASMNHDLDMYLQFHTYKAASEFETKKIEYWNNLRDEIDILCQNYKKFREMNCNNSKITRKIKWLHVVGTPESITNANEHLRESINLCYENSKKFIKILNGNYKTLTLNEMKLNLCSYNDIESIFHNNLKTLELRGVQTSISIDSNNFSKMKQKYKNIKKDKYNGKCYLAMNLHQFLAGYFEIRNGERLRALLAALDEFDLRYFVKCCSINYAPRISVQNLARPVMHPQWLRLFEYLFDNITKKSPHMSKIYISFHDDEFLHQFSAICSLIISRSQNIIDQTQIHTIGFNWLKFHKVSQNVAAPFQFQCGTQVGVLNYNNHQDNSQTIEFRKNVHNTTGEYICHYNLKEISHIECGILYRKLINAFQKLHQKVGDETKLRSIHLKVHLRGSTKF